MSLRHALLAILTAEEMTGYDLVKYFDGTVAFLWSAPHSQIYPELRKMEADGLVLATEVPRGPKATKRVYSLTEPGLDELKRWMLETQPPPPGRDLIRLKCAYVEWGDYESARRHLQTHRSYWSDLRNQFLSLIDSINTGAVPLLAKRLEKRPSEEHEAIIEFKILAYKGYIYQADAELKWADEGLELIDRLEKKKAPLTGLSHDVLEGVARKKR